MDDNRTGRAAQTGTEPGTGPETGPETGPRALPVLVLGAGSWGTALALQLARNGNRVFLWGRDRQLIEELQQQRRNPRYLPGYPLPESITAVAALSALPSEMEDAVFALPCQTLRPACRMLEALRLRRLCLACKGLQSASGSQTPLQDRLGHQLVRSLLAPETVAVLSGPSFAREVAQGLPAALTLAADSAAGARHFAGRLHSDNFRIYGHDDLAGVQVGGAVKNIMAIAAGVSDGLRYGANARAALITRGIREMRLLGEAFGAHPETFTGLSGMGDLILSCGDDQSRNRRFGLALAQGLSPEAARQEIAQTVEGRQTAIEGREIAAARGIELPVTEQVARLVQGQCSPQQAARALLSRPQKAEQHQHQWEQTSSS